MRSGGAIKHFLHDIVGTVQKLLDMRAVMAGHVGWLRTQLLRKLAVDFSHAIRVEDAASCRGIGNQNVDITAPQGGENCRYFVETTCHCDAHVDVAQPVERNTDSPVVKRA